MQNHNDMEMPTGIEIFLLHHASVVKFAASTVPPAAKYQNNRRGLAVIALKRDCRGDHGRKEWLESPAPVDYHQRQHRRERQRAKSQEKPRSLITPNE